MQDANLTPITPDPNVTYPGVMHPNDPLYASEGYRFDTEKENKANEPKEKQMTRTEYAKLMNLYWTRRNKTVDFCGHKFVDGQQPRHSNCEYCWFAYFQVHGEITKTADECFRNEGEAVLTAIQGAKFVKMFKRFMSTIAKFVEEQKQNEAGNTETSGEVGNVQEVVGSGNNSEQTVLDN